MSYDYLACPRDKMIRTSAVDEKNGELTKEAQLQFGTYNHRASTILHVINHVHMCVNLCL